MKMLKSLNNQLICTPIKDSYAKPSKLGNLQILGTTIGLAPLTVLMDGWVNQPVDGPRYIASGDIVYVRGEKFTDRWAKEVRECSDVVDKDGKPVKFIVVPGNEVIFVVSEIAQCVCPKQEDTSLVVGGPGEQKISRPDAIPAGPKVKHVKETDSQ